MSAGFNTTNYGAQVRSNIGNGQTKLAKANSNYLQALASGEGSLNMGRHKVHVRSMSLSSYRQEESFANQQAKDNLQAFKDLSGLSTLTQAA
jgi:hypothetical protein